MQQRRPGFPARLPGTSHPKPVALGSASFSGLPKAITPIPLAPLLTPVPMSSGVGMDSVAVRTRMVQRLIAAGISSPQVLQAMGAIERHRFIDSALVNQAYEDNSLPIGLGQTISKPSIVARMAQLLTEAQAAQENGLGRVLEIGTGCGYQAAVLSQLAREVYSIERLRGLHEKARVNLRPFRVPNLHLLLGDGMLGYAKGGPYMGIISAAGGTSLPPDWCDQLAVGGRLVAPTVVSGGQQMLMVVDKTPHGLKQTVLEPVHFVPLKSGIA